MKSSKDIYFILMLFMLTGCVDPINVDPGRGEQQVVVDGLIVYDPLDSLKTNKKDTVKLSLSVDYTDNETHPVIDNAFLTITDQDNVIDTLKFIGQGKYITQRLTPKLFKTYRLDVKLPDGNSYYAVTTINRLCKFESLTTVDTVRTVGPGGPIPAGGYVKMKAIDNAGIGDSYRIKYFVKRNPVGENPYYFGGTPEWSFYNQPRNLIIVSEYASGDNTPNSGLDKEAEFNLPIRVSVNTVEADPSEKSAYYPGDSIRVEIYSITREHLFFYYSLKIEIQNGSGGGFSGLFATPVANLPSNIINTNPDSDKKALGWFGAASLAKKSTRMVDYKRFLN